MLLAYSSFQFAVGKFVGFVSVCYFFHLVINGCRNHPDKAMTCFKAVRHLMKK